MKAKHLLTMALVAASTTTWAQSVGDIITVGSANYKVVGENLFVNGSFESGVDGWKTVGYATDAVASNFTLSSGGWDGGTFITTNGAGVVSENTIRQSVSVEPGKLYYFSVYTSGKAPTSNNFNYNALFKMKDAATEDGVLQAFNWPQGAQKESSEWSKTEAIITVDEAHPYVGVRMGWNENSSFDGFSLVEIEMNDNPYAQIDNGKYFIQNVEAGSYLSNGAYWGTRSVLAEQGIAYNVTVGGDGRYTLTSGIKNATAALRPSDGFNDQSGAWEIFDGEGGVYLYNGSKYFSYDGSGIPTFTDDKVDGSLWKFVAVEDRKSLVDGTTQNVDATVFITAPDFLNADVANSAWKGGPGVGGDIVSGSVLINNSNAQKWNAGAFDVYQEIADLPNGVYSLSAQGFYREGNAVDAFEKYESNEENKAVLYANAAETELKSIYSEAKSEADGGWVAASGSYFIPNNQANAAACFETGAYMNTLDEIMVTDGTLRIGVKHTGTATFDWTVFDSFRLTFVRPIASDELEKAAVENAKIELANAIAEIKVPTANVGSEPLQFSSSDVAALNSLVKSASDVCETATKLADVESAIESIKNAPAVSVNPADDSKKYNLVLTFEGYQYDNKAVTYIANDRTDMGEYNIQYKAPANANYAQAFTLTQKEGSKYIISQEDIDENTRYVSTGVPYGGNTAQLRTTLNEADALVIEIMPSATEEGIYTLWNTEANQYIGSQDAGFYTVNSHINFNIVKASRAEVSLNGTKSSWGTFMAPFSSDYIADGVTVYEVEGISGDALVITEASSVKAHTPYIACAEVPTSLIGWGTAKEDTYSNGILTGVYTATLAPVDSYVLQTQDDATAFYKVAEGKQPNVPANRCYITATSDVKSLSIGIEIAEEDTPLAIQGVNAAAAGTIYNAAGVKTGKLQKGMNIIQMSDGSVQKVMVK